MVMTNARPAPYRVSGLTVRRAQQGDSSAQDELARLCQRQAFLLALQLTGNRDDALEVAQDAVLRVLRALSRFKADRPVRPWLLQIVRNLVRDRARRQRVRRVERLDQEPAVVILEPADPGPDPEALAARHQLQELVWQAVQQLSPEHREVVSLRDYLDLSYDEIATVLKIPRGTVMSRLHRARQRLRSSVQASLRDRQVAEV